MLNRPTANQVTMLKAFALAGALIAASCFSNARADETVTRDRFSDEIVGQGPDLIFLPGLASSRDVWKAETARLKNHYRVHLIQIAGFAGAPSRANALADDLTLDLRPGLAQISTPLTLLFPDYVPLGAPPGANAKMYGAAYTALPGIKLVPIANSLHFIMLDQPTQFDAAVDQFLAKE
jgi:pimeloyl-ACP methyl ester carboxylesterase